MSFCRGNNHGPPGIRLLSSRLYKRVTPWQATVMTFLGLYLSRNFAKLVGLESPEPLANLYSRSYFRATWITTALDAGFWTAMNIKKKWLRDLASVVFSFYYLIAAEHADEKVRKVRAVLTVEHLRVSWNKATTPYLSFLGKIFRPRLMDYAPVQIRIPRPKESSYKEPCVAWLYYNGPISTLKNQTNIVLDIPGGGFVAMGPRMSDDKLLAWAGRTGVPVLSLDYKKAPEHPYPYALNECYDVYHTIISSRGRCMGLSGKVRPNIVITGDSAGGNLAAALTLMVLQSGNTDARKWRGEDSLPPPAGLVLIYPSLDMNIGSWMTDEEMSLIRERGMRETNRNILRRKSEDYYKLTPATSRLSNNNIIPGPPVVHDYFAQQHAGVIHEDCDPTLDTENIDKPVPENTASQVVAMADTHPKQIKTRLAVSSIISYFNDRILTPEMMRAMIILYIGPYNRPDFSTDFLLSPLLAPEELLARFPKTYFLTGERDPLVDDTVIFAGRIRRAKLHRFRERQELGLEKSKVKFDEKAHVEVSLIPGISHGFLQFPAFFPEAWKQIFRCSWWIQELFSNAAERNTAAERDLMASSMMSLTSRRRQGTSSEAVKANSSSTTSTILPARPGTTQRSKTGDNGSRHHQRGLTGESSGDEDRPLEMTRLSMTKRSSASLVGKSASAAAPSPLSSSSSSARSPADASLLRRESSTATRTGTSPPSRPMPDFPSPNSVAVLEGESPSSTKTDPISRPALRNSTGRQQQPPQSNGDTTKPCSSALSLTSLSPSAQHNKTNGNRARNNSNDNDPTHSDGDDVDANEKIIPPWRKPMMKLSLQRELSLTSLPSEEDLLGRRMNGLAGGLMGIGEGARTP
ncbi:esterase/lipase [[Emmonsia] crescens]|uniref:Esterase/lipase n=1 Tax=[Emmonsia] crescens TaxID=73230 RepID=A0A0G2IDR0_9EURO|nr:esterase/lipase [Emmonsia crescens UAMH 3008]